MTRYCNKALAVALGAALTAIGVCQAPAQELREGDGDLELVRWCSEVCTQCATADCPEGVAVDAWVQVVDACTRYATDCRTLEERISRYAQRVFRDHRDSGFQALAPV